MRLVLASVFGLLASSVAACPLLESASHPVVPALKDCPDTAGNFKAGPDGDDVRFRELILSSNSAAAVQAGIDAGGDPNVQSEHGSPAFVDLINFASSDDEAIVVEILEVLGAAGANFSTPDNYGDLALSKAAGGGELDTVRVLLRWRADPNGLNTYNRTPLFETVFGRCSPEVGRMLIQNGARVDVMPQNQIDRMFAEAAETCTNRQGRAYVRELQALAGR